MAGDKVLSGDCRFARRNYFPDARKEIVARVSMARSLRRRRPRHGDAQRVSPRHFSPATAAATAAVFFFTSSPPAIPPACFSPVPPPPLSPAIPFRLFFVAPSRSLPSFSRRASFNEKLISRVSRRLSASESRIFFLLPLLLLLLPRLPSRTLPRPYSASPFPLSPFIRRVRFVCGRRAIRASSFLSPTLPPRALSILSALASSVLLAFLLPLPPTHGCALHYSCRRSRSMLN